MRSFPEVSINGLSKRLAGQPLYENFSLDLARNKITALFGPNGCGKSTLLNMIAGLMPFDSGSILFDGRPLRDVRLGYVFQNYRDALMPWLSAYKNISFPLELLGVRASAIKSRIDQIVSEFDIRFDLN